MNDGRSYTILNEIIQITNVRQYRMFVSLRVDKTSHRSYYESGLIRELFINLFIYLKFYECYIPFSHNLLQFHSIPET